MTSDHVHFGERVKPYAYRNAGDLMTDFWKDVDRFMKKEKKK